jgi:hypothetical protein
MRYSWNASVLPPGCGVYPQIAADKMEMMPHETLAPRSVN